MATTLRKPKSARPKTYPKPRAIKLAEQVRFDKPKVDAEQGIVFDVKILGHSSDNKRRYTPESMKAATSLYEGRFVNIDHPHKATEARSSLDRTAWLENVRYVEGDGLRGNLRFLLPLDEFQKKVIWAAENKPDAWGLSHNADGKGQEDKDGVFVVEAITEVRSVDLVPDPATNRSLFEGKPVQTTLRQLIESLPIPAELSAKKKALLEDMDAGYSEMPVDAPADNGSDWRATLGRVAGELMASEDPEAHDVAKKIHGLLKPKGAEPPAAETATEQEDEDEKKDKDDDKKESRRPKTVVAGSVLLTEAKAKQFCRIAGMDPDKEKSLVEAMKLSTEDAALSLLEWAKTKQAPPPPARPGVRSQGPATHIRTTQKLPDSFEDYLSALRN